MNIVLDCEVILSKKLEAICEQGEPISILVSSVSGNKGRSTVRITCKDGIKEEDLTKIGETSIQFKVVGMSEDVKTFNDPSRFTNLISSTGTGLLPAVQPAVAKTSPDTPQGSPYVALKAPPPTNPLEAIIGNPD